MGLYRETISDFASGPPSNPSTGDVWYATNVDSNGTRWAFQYNAGSSSTYKWENIGGPPVSVAVETSESTSTQWSTLVDLATLGPTFTLARGGDYAYTICYRGSNSAAGAASIAQVKTGVSTDDGRQAMETSATAGATVSAALSGRILGLAAGDYMRMRYCAISGGTSTFLSRNLQIFPIRVA